MTTSSTVLTTGVPGLDVILDGGITPGSLVFLVGTPGAGKTILASQVVFHGARQGGSALIFTPMPEPRG